MTNLELLRRARAHEPDAHIIYKPHPDVVAGHRKGHVETADALRFADEIQHDTAITSLINAVDGVHVITSLAGFEALLRGKAVTTHGVPFYAGWGLTKDLGDIPARRTRRLSLNELVAGTLLLYPRYTDPVTRLPCPAELLVERMAHGRASISTPLITLRQWQGRLRSLLRPFIGGR
jgi:capsular polysaccharide export protein